MEENIKYEFEEVEFCEQIGEFEDEYVYDVEVDDDTHTFIANDILVHNSLFVSMKPAIDHSEWKNLLINKDRLESMKKPFILIQGNDKIEFDNPNCISNLFFDKYENKDIIKETINNILTSNPSVNVVIDGRWINNWDVYPMVSDRPGVFWNWSNELDYIHGIDKFKYGQYFKDMLDNHANKYGVENKQDFELERISESMINIAKKKYISHIVYEDGIPYDRLTYMYPKGVELVRSSTPLFARDKIPQIIKYLFATDNYNIKDLLKLVKGLKKEFDLCVPDRIDEISMQSSCSNYTAKVLNDKDKLEFVTGAHFAVKASAYHNYLLNKQTDLLDRYDYVKSGDKIKYYYCKDKSVNDIFAYTRGQYPIEIAPEIDLDTQFAKSILSPINSIIEPLGMPVITERLSVIMDIFGGM